MHLHITGIGQWRRIAVAGTTTGAGGAGTAGGDQAVMARDVGAVGHFPAAFVTGRTVAAGGEVLTRSTADPTTVDIVTAAAGIVNLRITGIDQRRRIQVTQATGTAGHRHQGGVARWIGGMQNLPGRGVTAGTVPSGGEVLADCRTDQGAGIGVMTANAVEMGVHADQGVIMTVCTGGTTDRHQSYMVRYGRMQGIPGIGVTANTGARRSLTDGNTD